MAAIEYLTVDYLNTKDLIRIFNCICVHPDLQHEGSSCWIWSRTRSKKGYGQTYRPGNRATKVHRLMFAWLVHSLPKGQKQGEIDHLCKRTSCCNPVHLEFVPSFVNALRGDGAAALNARKTHCLNGHELIPENMWSTKLGRQCKICGRIRSRKDAANYRRRHPERAKQIAIESNKRRVESGYFRDYRMRVKASKP